MTLCKVRGFKKQEPSSSANPGLLFPVFVFSESLFSVARAHATVSKSRALCSSGFPLPSELG